jgi:hypothetical protein
MTKQTQMYVGVGVVAIAGYFLWKSMQTKKGFMNASGSMVVTRGGKVVGKAMSAPVGTCKCSPNANANTLNGETVYECCAAGKYGKNPGPVGCGCGGGGGTKDKDFVGNNSKVFKGDKSFVGNNSKVFKGDNFVGDNSRVFKGDM